MVFIPNFVVDLYEPPLVIWTFAMVLVTAYNNSDTDNLDKLHHLREESYGFAFVKLGWFVF